MANKKYASTRYAIGICDRCGFRYPLHDLKFEMISAKGAPENKPSGLRVCPQCLDKPHPQAFLPQAVAAKLPDAQALFQPRPDVFPQTYAVGFTLPGSLYGPIDLTTDQGLSDLGLSLPAGFSGVVVGSGVFLPQNLVASTVAPLSVNGAVFMSPTQIQLSVIIPSGTAAGLYPISFSSSDMSGQVQIISGLINCTG